MDFGSETESKVNIIFSSFPYIIFSPPYVHLRVIIVLIILRESHRPNPTLYFFFVTGESLRF